MLQKLLSCFCCCSRNPHKAIRIEARTKLEHDLNIVYIIDTMYKLRSALKVMISDDLNLTKKIKTVYFQDKQIDQPEPLTKTDFAQFLEEDLMFTMSRRMRRKELMRAIFEELRNNKYKDKSGN